LIVYLDPKEIKATADDLFSEDGIFSNIKTQNQNQNQSQSQTGEKLRKNN
jgi:hypothetical protein